MATRTRGKARAAPPPPADDVDDVGDAPADGQLETSAAVQELEEAFADLPATIKVKLYRVAENGDWQWCWTGAAAGATEERAAKCGPGQYVYVARGELPNGGNGIRRRRFFHVAAMPVAEAPPAPNGQSGSGGNLADQVASTAVLGLLKSMQDAQEDNARRQREHSLAMAALFKQIMEPRQTDPLVMEIVKSQLGARGDPFELAAKITELGARRRNGSALSELAEALDTLEKLKSRVGGESDGGEGWAGLFKTIAARVLPHGDQPAPATPIDQSANVTIAADGLAAAEETPSVKLPAYLESLTPWLPMLVDSADRGVDPEAVADWFIANTPDAFLPNAKAMLERDTVTSDLVAAVPELRPHREWLATLRKSALDIVTEELTPDQPA